MENEIQNATSIHQINSVLKNWAGQYDLDVVLLAKGGLGISIKKGIVETPMTERGSVKEYTGHDVYSVESTKDLSEVKDLVVKSIRYRDLVSFIGDSD